MSETFTNSGHVNPQEGNLDHSTDDVSISDAVQAAQRVILGTPAITFSNNPQKKPYEVGQRTMSGGEQKEMQYTAGEIRAEYWEDQHAKAQAQLEEVTEQRDVFANDSMTDVLTGLPNRRSLMQDYENLRKSILTGHHRRSIEGDAQQQDIDNIPPQKHYILFVDADDFKQINDQRDHDGGDEVLVVIADTIRSNTRQRDILGRFGGDEFIVLLPRTTLEGAHDRAEAIRGDIPDLTRDTENGFKTASVSIGIAELDPSLDFNTMFKQANLAMKEAKRNGKNLVIDIGSVQAK